MEELLKTSKNQEFFFHNGKGEVISAALNPGFQTEFMHKCFFVPFEYIGQD